MNRGARAASCVPQCAGRGSQGGLSTWVPLRVAELEVHERGHATISASSMITHALVTAPYCDACDACYAPHRQPAQTVALTARRAGGKREGRVSWTGTHTRVRTRQHCREARARRTRREPLSLSRQRAPQPQRMRQTTTRTGGEGGRGHPRGAQRRREARLLDAALLPDAAAARALGRVVGHCTRAGGRGRASSL